MAKVNVDDLPTLDDFTESRLLSNEDQNADPDTGDDNDKDDDGDEEKDKDKDKTKKPDNKKVDPKPSDKKDKQDKKPDPKAGKQKPPVKTEDPDPDADPDNDEDPDDDKDPKDKDKDEDPADGTFWDDVQKITGIELEVEFGDVDPESAQGAALRDQALIEFAVENYIKTLEEKFPRAYKILAHEANGGRIEDLLTPNYVDYSKIELKEENKDQQKQILLDFYKSKGFDDKKAQRMVEMEEDSEGGLFGAAKEALAAKVKAQQEEEEKITKAAKQKQLAREQEDTQFLKGVKQIVDSGKLGQFNILTKKDREDFMNFVSSSVNHGPNDEGYVAVLPIDKSNIMETLQQLYFGFRKGKLDEFVARTAQTQNVRKLKRQVEKGDKTSGAGEDKRTPEKQLPTFDDFTV
jgi:hypothetical protein